MDKSLPKPATREAILISAGLTIPTPTKHRFVDSRLCELPGPGGGRAIEFIYECQETLMQRRWGTTFVPGDDPGAEDKDANSPTNGALP
jgi:hypothetical protein